MDSYKVVIIMSIGFRDVLSSDDLLELNDVFDSVV